MWINNNLMEFCNEKGPDDSDESKDDDDDICSQPAIERGKPTCRAFLPRWTFNTQLKVCQPITYGGCRGTKNLFETEYACNSKCNRKGIQQLIGKTNVINQIVLIG